MITYIYIYIYIVYSKDDFNYGLLYVAIDVLKAFSLLFQISLTKLPVVYTHTKNTNNHANTVWSAKTMNQLQ